MKALLSTFRNNFKSKSLGEVYNPSANLFDVLRLFLASSVIYFHAFPIYFGRSNPSDIIRILTLKQEVLGGVAVDGFFIISGFLITQSLVGSSSFRNYLKKRLLRIYPALIASVLLGIFVIGVYVTGLGIREYFSLSGGNNVWSYIFHSLSFSVLTPVYGARDVFQSNPIPGAINGSMWTIKIEFFMYLLLPLALGISYFKKEIRIEKLALGLFCGLFILAIAYQRFGYSPEFLNKFWFFGYEWGKFVKLGSLFAAGSVLYIYRRKIPMSSILIAISLAGIVIFTYFHGFYYAEIILMPYALIGIATMVKSVSIRKFGDISYGMYIYAFPVQQLLVRFGLRYEFFVIGSYLVTGIVSYLSWFFLEKPALSLKDVEINWREMGVLNFFNKKEGSLTD